MERVASLYAEIGADTTGLKRGLKESKAGLQDLSRSAPAALDKLKTGFTAISVAAGISAAAIFAFKKAFDFAAAGAELQYVEERFDRLAKSIGTTGLALMQDLRVATKNTISDAQLMAGAGDLMALGLAKTADEAVRLATVVAGLGMNMNQLVLTLTNQTTMRFDALNVAVDGFDEKVRKLQATGMSANDAFKAAFLQQAEEQLAKVGNKADGATASFDKLNKSLADLNAAAKRAASDGLAPYADGLGDIFGELARTIDLQLRYNTALDAGIITEQEKAQHKYGAGLYFTADAMDFLIQKTDAYNAALEASRVAMMDNNEKVAEYYRSIQAAVDEDIAANLKQSMIDLETIVSGTLGESLDEFNAKQMELGREAEVLRIKIAELSATNPTSPEQLESLAGMQQSLFDVNQAVEANAAAHEEATNRIIWNLAAQRAAIDGVSQAEWEFLNELARGMGIYDEATYNAVTRIDAAFNELNNGNLKTAIEMVESLGNAANSIEGDYYINFILSVVGEYPQIGNDAGVGVQVREAQNIKTQMPNISKKSTGTYAAPSAMGGGGGGGGASGLSMYEAPQKTELEKLLDMAGAAESLGAYAASAITKNVIDPLKQELEGIDKLMGPGFIDMYAMENMVALERRRAEAGEKLAIAEKQILEFRKQQERLGFLEQQIKLLDMIRENGLDAAVVLQGLKLGADADMGKVLEAMTRALEGKIGLIEAEMGIPSTSLSASSITQPTLTTGTISNVYNVTAEFENINSLIDWDDAAYRLVDIIRQRTT